MSLILKCEYCGGEARIKLVSIGVEEDRSRYVCKNSFCLYKIGLIHEGIEGIKTYDYEEPLVIVGNN